MFKDVKSGNTTNEKNDIWSAGMTFLFMLSGEKSFDDFQANKKEIIKRKIDCFDIDETTGSKLLDLIMKLLQD
jgi:serine/threonine protein kinase